MKTKFMAILALLPLNLMAHMSSVQEDFLYQTYLQSIHSNAPLKTFIVTQDEQQILVDALWDAKNLDSIDITQQVQSLELEQFSTKQKLRLFMLTGFEAKQAPLLSEAFMNMDEDLATFSLAYSQELKNLGMSSLVENAKNQFPDIHEKFLKTERSVGDQSLIARELWEHNPDLTSYANGAYHQGIKLYMFCRTKRVYSCLMLGKDSENRVILNDSGEVWTHPALASSSRSIPSYQRNGNTPAGVHHLDGVMPYADQNLSFGKFRRLIMNFVPKASGDARTLELLPSSSRSASWWLPASVARDVGRNLLRIHGTGRINSWPDSSWYPFIRTSGCVAQRENTYDGIEYSDQRVILDTLMKAQGLEVNFNNETRIKGLFYIIELNDESRAVTAEDLQEIGIL
jgi:hypothetical protein